MGHPLLDLTNKTAVVIGGTSGIGLALARGLAEAGANLVATGRREELVRKVASEIVANALHVTQRSRVLGSTPNLLAQSKSNPTIATSRHIHCVSECRLS